MLNIRLLSNLIVTFILLICAITAHTEEFKVRVIHFVPKGSDIQHNIDDKIDVSV